MTQPQESGPPLTDEEQELGDILQAVMDRAQPDSDDDDVSPSHSWDPDDEDDWDEGTDARGRLVQWSTGDDELFVPAGKAVRHLPPGAYDINKSPSIGLYFQRMPVKTEGLLHLPSSNIARVTGEIAKFWEREDKFAEYELAYKRGILLWGPPGCGKSSCIQLLMRDVIDRKGIVVNFQHPNLFIEGYRVLRQIEPRTPIIVIIEDIDALIEQWGESPVLNILDGIERVSRTVFIATTNYPEKLGARIVNRPSRFDKRFKIGYPSSESRKLYLDFIRKSEKVDVARWVRDTDGFTLAHLKELFVAVIILGDEYGAALRTLKSMKENKIGSWGDGGDEEEAPSTQPAGYA